MVLACCIITYTIHFDLLLLLWYTEESNKENLPPLLIPLDRNKTRVMWGCPSWSWWHDDDDDDDPNRIRFSSVAQKKIALVFVVYY